MSSLTRYLLIAFAAILIAAVLVPLMGYRLFVIAPRPGIPDGFVAIVRGAELKPFDSPEAVCQRWGARPDNDCVTRAITEVNRAGQILMRLPYHPVLAALSGVPADAR
ncbi:hypothetical protein [Acuticoccus sediminis]|uniref:hypothetical protein n=1 Tax=Acuticoccus sediminis TaxID=2184697 RepID=UPI001CFD21C3|nr:hypothetical protein [Acuticoccus sediminis]